MALKDFASHLRLKTMSDECGELIISGRTGQIFSYDRSRMGVMFLPNPAPAIRQWNIHRKALERVGCVILQDCEGEGTALFDPENAEQVMLALRVAGVRTKRKLSAHASGGAASLQWADKIWIGRSRRLRRLAKKRTGSNSTAPAPTVLPTSELVPLADSQVQDILTLHSHTDGYVMIAVGDDEGNQRPIQAIRADRLESLLPGFHKRLEKDSYVAINAGYRVAGVRYNARAAADSGYPIHNEQNLKYLTACYVDIDHYAISLDYATTMYRITRMEEDGVFPKYSFLIRSGRGVWLMWLLCDGTDPLKPQRAWPEKVLEYKRVNKELTERCAWIRRRSEGYRRSPPRSHTRFPQHRVRRAGRMARARQWRAVSEEPESLYPERTV